MDTDQEDSIERLIHLLNTYLFENIRGNLENPADLNLLKYDKYMKEVDVGKDMQKEYVKRATIFFNDFRKQFGDFHCAEILGFCPFCIEIYDEKKQEWIMKGEWRQKCERVIKFSLKKILQINASEF